MSISFFLLNLKALETILKKQMLDFASELYEDCPFPIISFEADFYFQKCNSKTVQYLGYSKRELFNMSFLDILVNSNKVDSFKKLYPLISGTNKSLIFYQAFIQKDKKVINLLVLVLGHYSSQKEFKGATAIALDVSLAGFPVLDFCNLYSSIPTIPHEQQTYWALVINMLSQKYHETFYQKIRFIAPGITDNDLRHAVFARLGIPAKQVGEILYTTTRSVETARYRLKKKLLIEKGVSLIEFLNKI